MGKRQTLYTNWQTDLRKMLFCIAILTLGTLYNIEEPRALAIAIIVQGASNVDCYWDFLCNEKICTPLKIMSAVVVLVSAIAVIFAVYTLGNPIPYFDMTKNNQACVNILAVVAAVVSPIVLLITDLLMNIQNHIYHFVYLRINCFVLIFLAHFFLAHLLPSIEILPYFPSITTISTFPSSTFCGGRYAVVDM